MVLAVAPFPPRTATALVPFPSLTSFLSSSSPLRFVATRKVIVFRVSTRSRSSLSSPRPHTHRKNHLRTKLLRSLTLDPTSRPSPPSPPIPVEEDLHEETPADHDLVLLPTVGDLVAVEEEVSEVVLRETEVVETLPVAVDRINVPRLLLESSLYLAALLAVQTVCAVVLFGGSGLEGTEDETGAKKGGFGWLGRDRREVGVSSVEGEDELEFEKKVDEIRAMARKARVSEAEQMANEEGNGAFRNGVKKEVNRRLERLSSSKRQGLGKSNSSSRGDEKDEKTGNFNFQKRFGLGKLRAAMIDRKAPKGFTSTKRNAESTEDHGSGGIEQIHYDSMLKESQETHKRLTEHGGGKTKTAAKPTDVIVSPYVSLDNNDPQTSMQLTAERLESIPPLMVVRQTDASQKASRRKTKSRKAEVPPLQSLNEKNLDSSRVSRKAVKLKSGRKIGRQSNSQDQLWWMTLPYVFGIYLQRGSDGNGYEGLYSLKMEPHSADSSSSCTIVFQDRGDATNLCYLLESFFEELGDVSADIVPMSIQELDEAVRTKALNVTVVRKGQLSLYAGLPVTEVEMALRSIISQSSGEA